METPHQKILDRQEKQKQEFIETFKKMPNVLAVCQRIGVGRTTYYRWLKEDKAFSQQIDEAEQLGREHLNDAIELALIQKAKEMNPTAMIYFLKHNHPRYTENLYGLPKEKLNEIAQFVDTHEDGIMNIRTFFSKIIRWGLPLKLGRYIFSLLTLLQKKENHARINGAFKLLEHTIKRQKT